MFKKLLNEGQAGDNVGLLLRGVKREDVLRGQVVCKPGSITPHTVFEGEVYCLSKEEGGRHTPFTNNYRPQFFFRTADITGRGAARAARAARALFALPHALVWPPRPPRPPKPRNPLSTPAPARPHSHATLPHHATRHKQKP